MGIVKAYAHLCQAFKVGGVHLSGISPGQAGPVIHVIDGDEEDIGATLGAHDRDQKNNEQSEVKDTGHQLFIKKLFIDYKALQQIT